MPGRSLSNSYNFLYNDSMRTISYSKLRAELAKTMEEVCEDHAPYLVTRQGGDPVVIISLEEYESLDETAYLLRSPANAKRLRKSIADLDKGTGEDRELLPCE